MNIDFNKTVMERITTYTKDNRPTFWSWFSKDDVIERLDFYEDILEELYRDSDHEEWFSTNQILDMFNANEHCSRGEPQ